MGRSSLRARPGDGPSGGVPPSLALSSSYARQFQYPRDFVERNRSAAEQEVVRNKAKRYACTMGRHQLENSGGGMATSYDTIFTKPKRALGLVASSTRAAPTAGSGIGFPEKRALWLREDPAAIASGGGAGVCPAPLAGAAANGHSTNTNPRGLPDARTQSGSVDAPPAPPRVRHLFPVLEKSRPTFAGDTPPPNATRGIHGSAGGGSPATAATSAAPAPAVAQLQQQLLPQGRRGSATVESLGERRVRARGVDPTSAGGSPPALPRPQPAQGGGGAGARRENCGGGLLEALTTSCGSPKIHNAAFTYEMVRDKTLEERSAHIRKAAAVPPTATYPPYAARGGAEAGGEDHAVPDWPEDAGRGTHGRRRGVTFATASPFTPGRVHPGAASIGDMQKLGFTIVPGTGSRDTGEKAAAKKKHIIRFVHEHDLAAETAASAAAAAAAGCTAGRLGSSRSAPRSASASSCLFPGADDAAVPEPYVKGKKQFYGGANLQHTERNPINFSVSMPTRSDAGGCSADRPVIPKDTARAESDKLEHDLMKRYPHLTHAPHNNPHSAAYRAATQGRAAASGLHAQGRRVMVPRGAVG